MIIDATTHTTSDKYRDGTLRAALSEATRHLAPHSSLHIQHALGTEGHPLTPRRLQIAIAQIIPASWKVFTELDGKDGVTIYRWS